MAQVIMEPKKTKEGTIDFHVVYHDQKSGNNFTLTITGNLQEALDKARDTLEAEVQFMQKK
ncbi:MAG: hypothetical protein H6R30_584 [Methanomicrobia archaeon]|jgi:hypothetical protein|nr:hypothetical protein [Methanomicrobia archaeon]